MNKSLVSLGVRMGSIWFLRSVVGLGIIATLIFSIALGVALEKLITAN